MIRHLRDVVQRIGASPDIVFVEFAVNGGDDPTNGAAYERLVLDILKSDNAPAVVLLFSVFKSQWNLQDRLAPIGARYGLPMVSIKDAVIPEINSGAMSADDFFSDIYHPTDFGHKIRADCVDRYFSAVDAERVADSDIAIPATAKVGRQFSGVRMIDARMIPSRDSSRSHP
jgi:hypothetical protein